MTRTVFILGLILIAAMLPLAALPVTIVLAFALLYLADVASFPSVCGQTATVDALPWFRGPPSR